MARGTWDTRELPTRVPLFYFLKNSSNKKRALFTLEEEGCQKVNYEWWKESDLTLLAVTGEGHVRRFPLFHHYITSAILP